MAEVNFAGVGNRKFIFAVEGPDGIGKTHALRSLGIEPKLLRSETGEIDHIAECERIKKLGKGFHWFDRLYVSECVYGVLFRGELESDKLKWVKKNQFRNRVNSLIMIPSSWFIAKILNNQAKELGMSANEYMNSVELFKRFAFKLDLKTIEVNSFSEVEKTIFEFKQMYERF